MASENALMANTSPNPRFSGTLADMLDRVTYRRARLSDRSDPTYRLRYNAYRHENFIPPNADKIAGDRFDDSPNAYSFGVQIGDELVSSVRIHHVTPDQRDSPSRTIWPDILDPILDGGESYIDPSRFTTDLEARHAYPLLPFLTLRIVTMAAEYFGTKYCLHSIRPEHGAFYERVFGSVQRGDLRTYEWLQFPVVMYLADINAAKRRVKKRFPVFMSTPEEREALFGGTGDEVYERRIVPSAFEAYRRQRRQEEISAA